MIDEHHQIGAVAERLDLSLRTIRYYEEIGLVSPSGRTEGGFRLYTESDIERLRLVKVLKPIGMSLEAMSELLECADRLASGHGVDLEEVGKRLQAVVEVALGRCDELEQRLALARESLHTISMLPAFGSR
ncbi:MAG TPA: MerR family transcriptional regulator [Acidimicrobiia bacterium]|nr:MerR family transcriptional regulator [Acidimicrobiia bacterium]